jgi:AcrR family transcriptional regulator
VGVGDTLRSLRWPRSDARQQASDEEQKGDREAFHDLINLTKVKLAEVPCATRQTERVPRPCDLPSAGPPGERADARRNRLRILHAAAELIGERGFEQVTIDDIAEQAGVAKGTVFHRFGNRAGLAVALLVERERRLQDRLLSGPPPLGPGAPPADRLVAFLGALIDFTDENLDLLIVSDYDEPGGRYRTGAYRAWRLHVAGLLDELGAGRRAAGLADTLLAPAAADLVRHRRRERRVSRAQVKRELVLLARAVCDTAHARPG